MHDPPALGKEFSVHSMQLVSPGILQPVYPVKPPTHAGIATDKPLMFVFIEESETFGNPVRKMVSAAEKSLLASTKIGQSAASACPKNSLVFLERGHGRIHGFHSIDGCV